MFPFPLSRPGALLDLVTLCEYTIIQELGNHQLICDITCGSTRRCGLTEYIGLLPGPLLRRMQDLCREALRHAYPPRANTIYTRAMEFLVLKRSGGICFLPDCLCNDCELKLNDICRSINGAIVHCYSHRRVPWNQLTVVTSDVERRVFLHADLFGSKITVLHIASLSNIFLNSIHLFLNLNTLHVYPRTGQEKRQFCLHLKRLLCELPHNCENLEELSLKCNLLRNIPVPVGSVNLLKGIRSLKHLYLQVEGLNSNMHDLVECLPLLERFGTQDISDLSPFARLHGHLGDEQRSLVWTAPVEFLHTPRECFDDHINMSGLVDGLESVNSSSNTSLGEWVIEGHFRNFTTLKIPLFSIARILKFIQFNRTFITSLHLTAREMKLHYHTFLYLFWLCPNLSAFVIAVLNMVTGVLERSLEVPTNNGFRELDVTLRHRTGRMNMKVIACVVNASANLERLILRLGRTPVYDVDLRNVFNQQFDRLHTFYLSGTDIVLEDETLEYVLTKCPLLHNIWHAETDGFPDLRAILLADRDFDQEIDELNFDA